MAQKIGTTSSSIDRRAAADVEQNAVDAYVYGYPLVLMDVTRGVMTATPRAGEHQAPINQFAHLRSFPDHTFTDVVSPNVDTLYSVAFLDLTKEPMVLSLPPAGTRYYLMQMLDAWTNVFASPGTRTTGNRAGDFAIVGPGWTRPLPAGVREIKASTNIVWIIGRTQTNGKNDYAAVHQIQDQYRLTPLSAFGETYRPPTDVAIAKGLDLKTPPAEQVANMSSAAFFQRLALLMKSNPPALADAGFLKRVGDIGAMKSVDRAALEGQARIVTESGRAHGQHVNGWDVMLNAGSYGTDYLLRAIVASIGLGANLPEDAVYPHATVDSDDNELTGANRYRLRFPLGQLPPVNAFWSITMYDQKHALVANPLNRYAVGDRDRMMFDPDGGLSIWIQHDSPGADRTMNWLPAPEGSFNVVMRLYWPKPEITKGMWTVPPIERLK